MSVAKPRLVLYLSSIFNPSPILYPSVARDSAARAAGCDAQLHREGVELEVVRLNQVEVAFSKIYVSANQYYSYANTGTHCMEHITHTHKNIHIHIQIKLHIHKYGYTHTYRHRYTYQHPESRKFVHQMFACVDLNKKPLQNMGKKTSFFVRISKHTTTPQFEKKKKNSIPPQDVHTLPRICTVTHRTSVVSSRAVAPKKHTLYTVFWSFIEAVHETIG